MRRNLFLIVLTFIAIFKYSPQALASSDTADDIPLLAGKRKTFAQPLTSSSEKPEMVLGPNIEKYMKYCFNHNQICNLAEALGNLSNFNHRWNTFRVMSSVEFHIPDEFIRGIFDDLQNPARVTAIKALIKQSTQRKEKEAEEAKAAAALNKPSVMDLSSFSSASLLNDSSSSAVASVMTSQLETPLSESCATTYDSQLRQRKTAQSTSPTIPSH